jgi:hypothetical protein
MKQKNKIVNKQEKHTPMRAHARYFYTHVYRNAAEEKQRTQSEKKNLVVFAPCLLCKD